MRAVTVTFRAHRRPSRSRTARRDASRLDTAQRKHIPMNEPAAAANQRHNPCIRTAETLENNRSFPPSDSR
jgi:hypothetical protein